MLFLVSIRIPPIFLSFKIISFGHFSVHWILENFFIPLIIEAPDKIENKPKLSLLGFFSINENVRLFPGVDTQVLPRRPLPFF